MGTKVLEGDLYLGGNCVSKKVRCEFGLIGPKVDTAGSDQDELEWLSRLDADRPGRISELDPDLDLDMIEHVELEEPNGRRWKLRVETEERSGYVWRHVWYHSGPV